MLEINRQANSIALVGALRIQYLDPLQQVLWDSFSQPEPLELDLSEVREVDTAGLQLLLSFLLTRQAVAPTHLSGMGPDVIRALELTGLVVPFATFTA